MLQTGINLCYGQVSSYVTDRQKPVLPDRYQPLLQTASRVCGALDHCELCQIGQHLRVVIIKMFELMGIGADGDESAAQVVIELQDFRFGSRDW